MPLLRATKAYGQFLRRDFNPLAKLLLLRTPDPNNNFYEERYRQRVMHHLARRAEKLGMQLVPAPQST